MNWTPPESPSKSMVLELPVRLRGALLKVSNRHTPGPRLGAVSFQKGSVWRTIHVPKTGEAGTTFRASRGEVRKNTGLEGEQVKSNTGKPPTSGVFDLLMLKPGSKPDEADLPWVAALLVDALGVRSLRERPSDERGGLPYQVFQNPGSTLL